MTVAITVTGPKTIILTVRVMFVSVVSIVSIAVSVFRFTVFIDVSVTVSVKTWLMVNFAVVIVTLRMRGVRFVIIGGVFGGVSRGVVRSVGFVRFIGFLIIIHWRMGVFLGFRMQTVRFHRRQRFRCRRQWRLNWRQRRLHGR